MTKIALLDDYQQVALAMADWGPVRARAEITAFDRNIPLGEAARLLAPFEIVCHVRERMAFPRAVIDALPHLRFIAVTGPAHRGLDLAAATERGIAVSHTTGRGGGGSATPELAIALMLAVTRRIALEDRRMRQGLWQGTVGTVLRGKILGLLGLGRVGAQVAALGAAFGMKIIAWSSNLTDEHAASCGARRVEKDVLFRDSDIVSLHLVLGERSRGTVGAREIALMRPTSYLVNTARGPIVDQAALIDALRRGAIAGAALDVYDEEPLPADHPLRTLENVVLTPHLGYVSEEGYRGFYAETVENVLAFLDGKPIRVLNPDALARIGSANRGGYH
ncbi:MAG TPA: D-2-hydroxyacid dehydrogenase family protein [Stellaceae bacterium]|nr:D-2-hydroxyacid dehydrogenase family protein [Stellaceae bacterium]